MQSIIPRKAMYQKKEEEITCCHDTNILKKFMNNKSYTENIGRIFQCKENDGQIEVIGTK